MKALRYIDSVLNEDVAEIYQVAIDNNLMGNLDDFPEYNDPWSADHEKAVGVIIDRIRKYYTDHKMPYPKLDDAEIKRLTEKISSGLT